MRRAGGGLLLILLLALGACSTAPGTGWSRAPDLSVYGAMDRIGGVTREQWLLCDGFAPAAVAQQWRDEFGAREAAVTAALVARHGEAAVTRAKAPPIGHVACPELPDLAWRRHYARMLRLLEVRLGLV